MTDKEFDLKLKEYDLKLRDLGLENERWHRDFEQRSFHWTAQRIFWLVAGTAAILTALFGGAIAFLRLFL